MAFNITFQSRPVLDGYGFDDHWDCEEWLAWYKKLEIAYGKKHANWLFTKCWNQQLHDSDFLSYFDGSAFSTKCTEFNAYMRLKGVKVSRQASLWETDLLPGLKTGGIVLAGVAVVGLAGYAAFQYYSSSYYGNRTLAKTITRELNSRVPRQNNAVSGLSTGSAVALGITAAAALGVGAWILTSKVEEGKYSHGRSSGMKLDTASAVFKKLKSEIAKYSTLGLVKNYKSIIVNSLSVDAKRNAAIKKKYPNSYYTAARKELLDIFFYFDTSVSVGGNWLPYTFFNDLFK